MNFLVEMTPAAEKEYNTILKEMLDAIREFGTYSYGEDIDDVMDIDHIINRLEKLKPTEFGAVLVNLHYSETFDDDKYCGAENLAEYLLGMLEDVEGVFDTPHIERIKF